MTCRDCPDRKVGCHSNCDVYKADRAKERAIKEAMKEEHLKDSVSIEVAVRRRKNYERMQKRRRGY